MVEGKAFLANPKHQYHVSQFGEHDCSAHNKKQLGLSQVSKFVSFHGWTLIIGKIMERKASLANPKHQYCVSQYGEYDCSANNNKNGDYNEYPSLSHLTDEL